MDLEEQLMDYKKMMQIVPKEEKIQEAIRKSKAAFYAAEQNKMLSWHEFLWVQLKVIQKRWWLMQAASLALLWFLLFSSPEDFYIQRSMGVIASLFVILIIPELWKSRSNQCMEIETAAYYSLRQICSARMLLFGIVDISLVTLFCGAASITLRFALTELLIQFLFPMAVTTCICFKNLCSRHHSSEMYAVISSIVWSSIWMLVTLNDSVYKIIVFPVWAGLFVLTLAYLGFTVYRTWKCVNMYEVIFDGIEI